MGIIAYMIITLTHSGGPGGMLFKDTFFRVMGAAGVVAKEYVSGALPKM